MPTVRIRLVRFTRRKLRRFPNPKIRIEIMDRNGRSYLVPSLTEALAHFFSEDGQSVSIEAAKEPPVPGNPEPLAGVHLTRQGQCWEIEVKSPIDHKLDSGEVADFTQLSLRVPKDTELEVREVDIPLGSQPFRAMSGAWLRHDHERAD